MSARVASVASVFKTIKTPVASGSGPAKGAVIFFHGSGHSGQGLKSWIEMLLKRDICHGKLCTLYPSAPQRPYTPAGGQQQAVWFDRKQISFEAEEDLPSIDRMCNQVAQLIEEEVQAGTCRRNIVLGGFSMGGALAMYLAFRRYPDVAAVFTLSSFLNERSCVYESLSQRRAQQGSAASLPKLFMAHGSDDTVVPQEWGVATAQSLRGHGVHVELHSIDGMDHEMDTAELTALERFIFANVQPSL